MEVTSGELVTPKEATCSEETLPPGWESQAVPECKHFYVRKTLFPLSSCPPRFWQVFEYTMCLFYQFSLCYGEGFGGAERKKKGKVKSVVVQANCLHFFCSIARFAQLYGGVLKQITVAILTEAPEAQLC